MMGSYQGGYEKILSVVRHSLGKTGEGNLKGRPAKPGSPGRA